MKKYILTIRTEELRGRMSASRTIKCNGRDEAIYAMSQERSDVYRRATVFDEFECGDEIVIEHFPRMRTTLTISEA